MISQTKQNTKDMKKGNITDIVIGDLVFIVPNDELAKVVVAEVVRHERINDYYSKLTAKSEEGAEYTFSVHPVRAVETEGGRVFTRWEDAVSYAQNEVDMYTYDLKQKIDHANEAMDDMETFFKENPYIDECHLLNKIGVRYDERSVEEFDGKVYFTVTDREDLEKNLNILRGCVYECALECVIDRELETLHPCIWVKI